MDSGMHGQTASFTGLWLPNMEVAVRQLHSGCACHGCLSIRERATSQAGRHLHPPPATSRRAAPPQAHQVHHGHSIMDFLSIIQALTHSLIRHDRYTRVQRLLTCLQATSSAVSLATPFALLLTSHRLCLPPHPAHTAPSPAMLALWVKPRTITQFLMCTHTDHDRHARIKDP